MYRNRNVSVIIPALNEEDAIGPVVAELVALSICKTCSTLSCQSHAQTHSQSNLIASDSGRFSQDACEHDWHPLVDRVTVCDNGSTDHTARVARKAGAHVVSELTPGYGAACYTALSALVEKDLIVFVDGDYSVVSEEVPRLLQPLIDGEDLVIGSRTLGNCERGALTLPQRFGNRLAALLILILWRKPVSDLGPFRAITYKALMEIDMQDRAFGWTVEMQVRAIQLRHRVVEVPITTKRRIGQSKISGTLQGVIGAGRGILGMIAKLYLQQVLFDRSRFKRADRRADERSA